MNESIADHLQSQLTGTFGTDWRSRLTVKERLDKLYWIVWLAEKGIEASRREWTHNGRRLDGSEAASLASWKMGLQAFAEQIGQAKKI